MKNSDKVPQTTTESDAGIINNTYLHDYDILQSFLLKIEIKRV